MAAKALIAAMHDSGGVEFSEAVEQRDPRGLVQLGGDLVDRPQRQILADQHDHFGVDLLLRVRAFHESAERLMAELEAEGANL